MRRTAIALCASATAGVLLLLPPSVETRAKPPDATLQTTRADRVRETALRGALRTATVQLAARALQAANAATPPRSLPLMVLVGPVIIGAAGVPTQTAVAGYAAEGTALRGMVVEFVGASVTSGGDGSVSPLFVVRESSPQRPRRGHGTAESTPLNEAAQREVARRAGADYVIEETLQTSLTETGAGATNDSRVHLALQMVDARDGTTLCVSDAALPAIDSRKN